MRMYSSLNPLYKHTMRLVLSFVCQLIGSGDGSTLIICRRWPGRIKTKLQISACCDARTCTLVHNWRKVGPVPAFQSRQSTTLCNKSTTKAQYEEKMEHISAGQTMVLRPLKRPCLIIIIIIIIISFKVQWLFRQTAVAQNIAYLHCDVRLRFNALYLTLSNFSLLQPHITQGPYTNPGRSFLADRTAATQYDQLLA